MCLFVFFTSSQLVCVAGIWVSQFSYLLVVWWTAVYDELRRIRTRIQQAMKSQDNTKNFHVTVESLVAFASDTSDDPSLDNKVDSMSAGMGDFQPL